MILTLASPSREHFQTEENVLERAGYPDQDSHRKLHGAHIVQLFDLINHALRYCSDNSRITASVISWLKDHMEDDLKHAGYSRE